ncbi:MAG: SRPBCC domain-containing protein [Sneathiellales bacterium]|nr:SRPBCC domain-containing protein [Sneathiellales bacterium]
MSEPIPLIVSRWIKAPPEKLFAAFKDREELPKWFIPDAAVTLEVRKFEFHKSGSFEFRYHQQGERSVVEGHFTALKAPSELSFTWNWHAPNPLAQHPMHVRFDFRAEKEGTTVIVTHTGIPSSLSCVFQETAWADTLQMLENYLSASLSQEKAE